MSGANNSNSKGRWDLSSKQVGELLGFEERHSAGAQIGKLVQLNESDAKLFSFLQVRNDARGAEIHTLRGQSHHPILKLRTLIFRGLHSDANEMIQKIETQKAQDMAEPETTVEIAVEHARLLIFEGKWEECISRCDQALSLDPIPLSMMTACQVRALALYELGRFREALDDLDRVESLIGIFPDAQSGFYSAILRFRVLGKLRPGQQLSRRLEELYSLIRNRPLSPDFLLTLLRAEIECRTDAGEDLSVQALACYRIADLMGDRLYAGLAALDVSSCGTENLRSLLVPLLAEASEKFSRIQVLENEVQGKTATRSTSASLVASSARKPTISESSWKRSLVATHLVLSSLEKVIELGSWQEFDLSSSSQAGKVLHVLSRGPIAKADFFKAIWGSQKYAPHLHDGLIWNTIHRLRSRLQIEITLEAGLIDAKSVLFL